MYNSVPQVKESLAKEETVSAIQMLWSAIKQENQEWQFNVIETMGDSEMK